MIKESLTGYYYKVEHEAMWKLVFYHNLTQSNFTFFKISETSNYNRMDIGMYSILYSINSKYLVNDKYEFLLEYPELNRYNHWRQLNNPINEMESEQNASGYDPITIQMPSNFGGISKSIWT